ncbi:MAG: cache domain-containing protein, partial [Lentisphaeria bacterium]
PALRYYVQGQSFSYAELSVFLRQSFADMKSQKVIWLESTARELAPDTVLWTSRGRNPVVEAGGREIEYLLAESWVWRKFGGVWKAVHYQESFLEMPSREKCARVEVALAAFAAGFKPEARDPQSVMPALEKFVRGHDDVAGAVFAFAPRQGAGLPVPYVFRRHGELVRKLEPADSYLQCDWYAKPAGSGKLAWSEPYFDTHGAEKMMITCGLPLFDAQGQLQGVLTADVAFY